MDFEVIIVGAGPAGIGSALALRRAGVENVMILEGKTVGSSFLSWPEQMRMITPSFHANPFFQTDLNAITPDTSPADFYQTEHLSGRQYAKYLQAVVHHLKVALKENTKVTDIIPESNGYRVKTEETSYSANNVIWAGGEYSHPKVGDFPGAEHCAHSSVFRTWEDYKGDDAIIIGGYESGIDTAFNLAMRGKKITVLSSAEPWNVDHPDPSETLSPYTRDRLVKIMHSSFRKNIDLRGNANIVKVDHISGEYVVETEKGDVYKSKHRPIAAIGFESALTPIKELFDWEEGVIPLFTEDDESTLNPGLFYSGPSLVHLQSKFCFIHKFRARFGVIARAIARRLGYPEPDLEDDRLRGFLVDDLECCVDCECAVDSEQEPVQAKS